MTVEAELRGVRVRYGPLEALHGVDLAFPAGRVTVLLGRNGSGRTTALSALAGVLRPSAGRVLWRGREVSGVDAYRRARLGLAMVPAERAVFASLTVAENLRLPGPGGGEEAAGEIFPELAELLDRQAGTLSGGQQQLVALGRALLGRPRLLLLDEPDRGLAPAVTARLHGLLLDAAREGRTVVVAAQVLPRTLAPEALVHELHRGRVVFSGEPGELARDG
ncbi:ABC transporter ATP-binding protein [Kitasatospora atroaurantiaca]|uniref:Amino acid/amide ABC transporter ATP-binding protein 2 (HAAT family) n=1 Tax=Kitasatospora atroaurantiaca TaxID=285545 RepID=A0A561F0U3_9ACTN|nr:ATP-binding cassette domain-containing protein [Kitasatospora atroaurantiaca]TWE21487.1 amino acid/amide ABC transporter ATP-binding protein 2 (HAAT family) [Kitasatospora atroaurantiaca]